MAHKNFARNLWKCNLVFLLVIAFCPGISPVWAALSAETQRCIACHQYTSSALYSQWASGKHAAQDIGCYECHQAGQEDPDLFVHNDFNISIIVSPLDCARCHQTEVNDYDTSLHAKAVSIPVDMGRTLLGDAVVRLSCLDCHGTTVQVLEGGRLDPDTWPNTGVGRLNPDGSRGGCSACHQRHNFSRAQARRPRTCGRCHMGHGKPQIHLYEASKHGIAFDANEGLMNLDSDSWVVGVDYHVAPTCSTCHLSAGPGVAKTHNPANRLTWVLREEVSRRRENWQTNKNQMLKICTECHASDFVANWYENYDGILQFYDNKFGQPAADIMSKLRENGELTAAEFDDRIEWIYFYLYNDEARKVRNAAGMQAHESVREGFMAIADYFYTEFLPEAKSLSKEVVDEVLAAPEHQWYAPGDLIENIRGASAIEPTPDLNQDGKVDGKDLFYFGRNWHR